MQTLGGQGVLVEATGLVSSDKKNVIRVLHVDDDPSILEVTKLMLMDLERGLDIVDAYCVDEAFKKLSMEQYDVVISDYEMPQKDGLAFLKELRDQKNDIPFVLFTGKGREEVAIKALNLGAEGYINKQGNPETVYGELVHTLRLSVERHRSKVEIAINALAFQNVENAIITADKTQTILSWNKAAEDVFGYSTAEAEGKRIEDIFGPMQVEVSFQEIARAIQDKERFCSEVSYKDKKGEHRFGELTILPQLNGCGKVSGSTMICHDITERRKFNEALLVANRRYELAQRAAKAGVWDWDVKTGEIKWTPKMFELFGLDPKKAPASFAVWESVLHPQDKERAKANIKKSMQYHSFLDNEYRVVLPDGEIRWINALGEGEYDETGNPLSMSGICIDITERKKAEEALKTSEMQFRQLFSNMPSGVAVYEAVNDGKDFVFRNFNAAAEGIEKIKREKVIGKRVTKVFPGVENFGLFNVFKQVWQTGESEYYPSALYKDDKDLGTWRENWVYKLPNGNIVAIYNDITERKKSEEQLKKESAKMEIMNEKLNVVGKLTRHDVGNKLMVMKSNIYLLKKQIGDNSKLAKYLEGIDSAIDKSNEMFEFNRFYEEIGVETPSEIDVVQCFNQALALLPNLGTIKIVNDCQGVRVTADSLLKQLFYNFLDNSLKHGEKVTQIQLYFTKEQDGVKLFYEDNGVGVPEANKQKLFQKGFTTGKSTGLGLFLIKKMVEVYDWIITEEGEPGKGAKFVMNIPKFNNNGKENYQIVA
jgi:PAS domain S-box-containing protein